MENGAKYKNLAVLNQNQNTRSRASGSNSVYALLRSWLNMVSLFSNSDGRPRHLPKVGHYIGMGRTERLPERPLNQLFCIW